MVTLRDVYDASWGADGKVTFSVQDADIVRQAVGGVPDTVFRGDTNFILGHPMPLPSGDGAVFVRVPKRQDESARSEIVGVSYATKRATVVGLGVWARVLKSGALLFASAEGTVFLAPFDRSSFKMTGPAVPIARVAMGANAGRSYPQISVSDEGTFMYMAGDLQRQRLAWLDASGRLVRRLTTEGDFWGIALSPDGTRLAYTLRTDTRDPRSAARGTGDTWIQELSSGATTRLTTEWFNMRPSWSPDGKSVMYTRLGGPENQALFERRVDASEPEHLVLSMKQFGHTVADGRWFLDHKTLIVRTYRDQNSLSNLYSTTAGGPAQPYVINPPTKGTGVPSPDGTLVAYQSDETGVDELYVERFPSSGERILVSKGGASPARWSRDSKTLWYFDLRGTLVVASVATRPTLTVTGTREIRTDATMIQRLGKRNVAFDIAPDGRIIIAEDIRGSFDLVLVRNGMPALGKVTPK